MIGVAATATDRCLDRVRNANTTFDPADRLVCSISVTDEHETCRATASRLMKEGTVPLSEHEQRLLDEIEQALYAEDPKFASVRALGTRPSARTPLVLLVRPRCRRRPRPGARRAAREHHRAQRCRLRAARRRVRLRRAVAAAPSRLRPPLRPQARQPRRGSPGRAACARAWKTACAAASTRTEPPGPAATSVSHVLGRDRAAGRQPQCRRCAATLAASGPIQRRP